MNSKSSFRIKDCLIDPELNTITCQSEVRSVEPRVMAVLMVLAESAGKVVTRNDLIERVWGDRITSDSSLSRNVALLRKLIDSPDDDESCIKTVPKKGYMLVEPIAPTTKTTVNTGNEQKSLHNNETNTLKASTSINTQQLIIILSFITLCFSIWLYFSTLEKTTDMFENNTAYSIKEGVTVSPNEPEAAFCFDGLDDYIEVPSRPAIDMDTNDFSLSAWIKTTTYDIAVILDKRREQRSGNVLGYNFHILRGEVGMQLADGKGIWRCINDPKVSSCTNYYSGARVDDGEWHFVAVTIDRDNREGLRFYVDGELVRKHNPLQRQGSLSNEQPLRVGSRSSSKSGFYPGHMGEVKIYRYALTAEEIKQQFKTGNQRTCERR